MRVDFHHIAVEYLDRFPDILRSDPNLADAALRGDISRLPDRIRRNYKAAVPQRYRGEIQILLPLDLVAPRGRPDLALVVERKDGGCRANYSPRGRCRIPAGATHCPIGPRMAGTRLAYRGLRI